MKNTYNSISKENKKKNKEKVKKEGKKYKRKKQVNKQLKMNRCPEQSLFREDLQMANRHMKDFQHH